MPSGKRQINSILIATLGSEPQVITATLDLLLQQGETICEAAVIHTVSPQQPLIEAVHTLSRAFVSAPYQGQITLSLSPLYDEQGLPLPDVETPRAIEAAFRAVYKQVRQAKLGGKKVHLSIAGGRKPMALFGMLAAQLLFEDEDRLWHLYSGGDFLSSKRLHPRAGDEARLIPIPVVFWSRVSPMLLDLSSFEDPYKALKRQQELRLAERLQDCRSFVCGSLTPAEERATALLVKQGLSVNEIAGRLSLSPRTIEGQLRAAYQKAAAHWELPAVKRAQLITLLNLYYTMSATA